MGNQIHCEAVKLALNTDVSVSNTLLSLYAGTEYMSECWKVFSLMHGHDCVSWNSIIRAFCNSGAPITKATEYFIKMMRAGWTPDNRTFISILSAAASHSHVEVTGQIHALVLKHHLVDDNTIGNALLSCYGKCGEIDACESIFSRMSEKDEVSWNSMISGYIHGEQLSEAMNLVWLMVQNGQKLARN